MKLVSNSFKLIDRVIIFWNNNNTSPIPNSIAEKTKKKKVRESIFKLSKIKPINKTIAYKVIQSNSAVSNKWIAVFVLIIILNKIKKKKRNNMFKSPIIIYDYLLKTLNRLKNYIKINAKIS